MNKALLLSALLLMGCTTTEQAMQRASSRFVGRNFDEFVLAHGMPYARHQMNNGNWLYAWSSGVISYDMPTTTSMSGSVTPYGSYYGTAITTGGGSIDVCCEVEILTTEEGTILGIRATADTWGKWTTSRCAEIFTEAGNTTASIPRASDASRTDGPRAQQIVVPSDSPASIQGTAGYKLRVNADGKPIKDRDGNFIFVPVEE